MEPSKLKYRRETVNIWFPNQKEPFYDKDDEASVVRFRNYWKREKKRMIEGFYLADGKVFVSGWLYWHTVYWKIKMKKRVGGRSFPVIETPILRDIDWEAAQNFERAKAEGVFTELVGSRGFGKSVWQSSIAGHFFTLIDKSQTVVSAANADDIKTVTDMINQGLLLLHPALRKQWLRKDWKVEILAGFKEPDGSVDERSSLSQIIMRNFKEGNDSMAINGTRPDFHIIDEIGKLKNFIKCVKDSDGAYWANTEQDDGGVQKPTCFALYTGTGGDMERGKDAAEMFFNPLAYHLLAFDDVYDGTGGKIGWFMPVTKARMEFKKPQTLAKYLGIDNPDLEKITILVSDEKECYERWWLPKYKAAKSSGNSTTLNAFLAYWPLKPSDAFRVVKANNFNVDAAKEHKKRLINNGTLGTPVELFFEGTEVVHKFSEKLPITQFPVKDQDKDAPVMIYEWPMQDPPYGLYLAGVDPYRHGKAKYSDSLGVVYIFKRVHNIMSESFQYMIVASYAARPNDQDYFNEQARMLIRLYNARTLVENDEMSFIRHMINKGDAERYLERQPQWLKNIVPGTEVERDFGIHRSADKIRDFLMGETKKYLDAVIYRKLDDNGGVVEEQYGVRRVPDIMLLEEIINYNEEEGNYDRIVAFSLVIAFASVLDGLFGPVESIGGDNRAKFLYQKRPRQVMQGLMQKKKIIRQKKSRLFL